MQVRNIVFGISVAALLAACSFERQQVDYKAGAVQAHPLEVPPDLTAPEADQRFSIPGTEGQKAANYSEYSRKKAEQPCVNPVPSQAPVEAAAAPKQIATLQDGKGGKRIQLEEPFDRGWRRIGLALEQARIAVSDKDRSKGVYFVSATAKDKKKAADYQVIVRETKTGSEAVAVNNAGKTDAGAAQVLEAVYQNLADKSPAQVMPPSDGQFFGDAVRPLR